MALESRDLGGAFGFRVSRINKVNLLSCVLRLGFIDNTTPFSTSLSKRFINIFLGMEDRKRIEKWTNTDKGHDDDRIVGMVTRPEPAPGWKFRDRQCKAELRSWGIDLDIFYRSAGDHA